MSVFQNIKGTIQSVQQDISTSIKSLTASSKEKEVKVRKPKGHGVNLDAGADLLHRYQENWSELHQQAEENASNAENLAVLIGSLYVRYSRQSDNLTQLKEEASTLPTILQQLHDLTNQIAKVEELCEQVEAAEIQLENICEVEEFNKAQTAHQQQLAAYREKRQRDVEKFKVSLAQKHAKNIKSRDMKKQAQLKERQSIFQEAFDKDINYYRTFGHTERQPSVENETAEMKLAEMKIEEDVSGLNSFLESTDVIPLSDRPPGLSPDDMPDDESDSGVINDRSESPEDGPSGLPLNEGDSQSVEATCQEQSGDNLDQSDKGHSDRMSDVACAEEKPQVQEISSDDGAKQTVINGESVQSDAVPTGKCVQNDAVPTGKCVQNDAVPTGNNVQNDAVPTGTSVQSDVVPTGTSVQSDVVQKSDPESLAKELAASESLPSAKESQDS